MGLLVARNKSLTDQQNQEADWAALRRIAKQVARLWDEGGGGQHGFDLSIGERELRNCCSKGSTLLETYFSNPPSPFKRVAALVVLARLSPFIGDTRGSKVGQQNGWRALVAALLIPSALRAMKVNIAEQSEAQNWIVLDKWKGFPSAHVKVEFLAWLEWLDPFQNIGLPDKVPAETWESMLNDRLARMILATSLMLENMYYLNEAQVNAQSGAACLLGQCRRCMQGVTNLTGVTYDSMLVDNYRQAHAS